MSKSTDYAKHVARGSTTIFIGLIVANLIGFLLRMFLTRTLSITDYGLLYAVFALVSLFVIFRDLGLCSALVKYIPEFVAKKQFGKIKSSMALVTLVQGIIAVSISLTLFIFSDRIAAAVFRTGSAVLPLKIFSVWFAISGFYPIFQQAFRGFQNMGTYALMEISHILLVFLLTFLLVGVFAHGSGGVAFAYLLAALAMFSFGLLLFRRHPQVLKEKAGIDKPLTKTLFAFALPVFITGLGGIIIGYMNTLMLTTFRSLDEVALYQTAQPTVHVLEFFPIALAIVLFPLISELWSRKGQKILDPMLHFLTKFSFILIMPAALTFIAFPETVLRLLFGPSYVAGATALQILACAVIIFTLYKIMVSTMAGIGKPVVNMKALGVMAYLNFVGNLLLIPRYGIEGAAMAMFISYMGGLVFLIYYIKRFTEFTLPASSLLKTVLGAVLTLLLIFGLKRVFVLPSWPEAFAVMIPGLLFYGGWILLTRALTRDDLSLLRRVVPMPEWLVKVARKFVR